MNWLSRREFLKTTGAAGAVTGASFLADLQAGERPSPRGPNERLNVCVIGIRGRGADHLRGFAGRNNCVVTHVCDADSGAARNAITNVNKAQGSEPRFEQDLRRIMENRDIHIVSIATPNHWHALAAIWAMQNGKDVYVEKPVSHNVSEGRRMVEIARHHNKICQAGTQIRSALVIKHAIDYLQAGRLGRLQVARALCYKPRGSIGRAQGEQAIPKTVNYDLWCGPAPRNPLRRLRLHYDWHWTWDYGNGDLGNQGIHQMDVARWGLGKNELARSVVSVGGRFGYTDDGETANTQVAMFDYGDQKLIFEVRGLRTDPYRGAGVGNVFHCSDGYLVMPGYDAAIAYDNRGREIHRWEQRLDTEHYDNFVRAVRSRRREDLNGDILEGHLSSALCHLANISYRMGRPVAFNDEARHFGADADAAETFDRMRTHLRSNQIPLEKTSFINGPRLVVDVKAETFGNNRDANRHLTREYREGFVVPARV